jgi:hypothetical protein
VSKYSKLDEDLAEARIAKIRERIRQNFPNLRAPLQWRKDSESRLVSQCGRFAIEKSGHGDAVRYTAKVQPHAVIGVRLFTAEQAKEVCNRHASPLPLEPVQQELVTDREPGSDDE